MQGKEDGALPAKQVILYTGVSRVVAEDITSFTRKWYNVVNENCTNKNGCTSDLNYYESYDAADKEYQKLLSHYSDVSKYTMVKLKSVK